jgi:hypothetical protein
MEHVVAWLCRRYGRECKGYQILETDRKTPIDRHRYRWNENNVDHEGKKYDGADWM